MNLERRYFTATFSIIEALNDRIVYLDGVLEKLKKEYEKMPEGSILVAPGTSDSNFRYYLREKTSDKMGTYLKADQEKIKKMYATKKYYKELIKNIENEISQLKKALENYQEDSIVSTYKKVGLGITRLISPLNIDDNTFAKIWISEKYEGLGFAENDTSTYYSERNERMRSKSELLIANALNKQNIPYKYEYPLLLDNGTTIYPDFTVLDVRNREVKYWEHLGRMGDMSYVSKNMWKLEEYNKMGIRLGINLFVTYENGINQLGTNDIAYTIEAILK